MTGGRRLLGPGRAGVMMPESQVRRVSGGVRFQAGEATGGLRVQSGPASRGMRVQAGKAS